MTIEPTFEHWSLAGTMLDAREASFFLLPSQLHEVGFAFHHSPCRRPGLREVKDLPTSHHC